MGLRRWSALGAGLGAVALAAASCTTPLELGERRYRAGDRLSALETWRAVERDSPQYEAAQDRIDELEQEFEQLVVRYKKRAHYYEEKGRLAESVLNYRLALKLQPDDRETLDHVQSLVRTLDERRAATRSDFQEAFAAGELAEARAHIERLRKLDPFDPELATDERQLEAALRSEVERLLARGRRGFSSGQHARAEAAFREVLHLDPGNESAQGYLSYIDRIRAEESRAARQAGVAAEVPGVDATDAEIRAEGFYQNALAAERAGDFYTAIRYDLRALRADADHPRARPHLRRLRQSLEPNVPELIRSGRTHFQQEDLQTALDQWRRALLIEPSNEQAREYAARAERMLENLEDLRAAPPAGVGAR